MRFLCFMLMACLLASGCENTGSTSNTGTEKDNTAINERDSNSNLKTPFDQSNDQADIDLVARIRAKVLEIDELSINGRNVKIITNEGKVVLRGPVDSSAERNSIETVAKSIAGDTNVTSNLEVVDE